MDSFSKTHKSLLGIALLFILMQGILFAQADMQEKDTILTVSEARIDANNDFIPDRIGQKVTVGGRANVGSGVLRTERLQVFLQDEKSGIEIYNTEPGPAISEGDSVIATGYVEQFEGLTRITRTTYRKIPVLNPMPPPLVLNINQANDERYEGRLLRVGGQVTGKWDDAYGSYLCLRESKTDADSLTVFISFRHQAGIDFSKYEIGDQLVITGILGQYVGSGALNTGYELLPRYPTDISTTETFARMFIIAALSIAVLAVVLLWVWLRRRKVAQHTNFGGERVLKSTLRTDAYDAVDELNAQLGVVRANMLNPDIENILEQLQNQLSVLCDDLMTPQGAVAENLQRIQQNDIQSLEITINRIETQLGPSQSSLPGVSATGAQLHVARTVCRRAERLVDALGRKEEIGTLPQIFLNRLADLLFVLARYVNTISQK